MIALYGNVLIIYGTAYPELKMDFIAKLHDILESTSYTILLCGDFNLVKSNSVKVIVLLIPRLFSYLMIGSIGGDCKKFLFPTNASLGLITRTITSLLS